MNDTVGILQAVINTITCVNLEYSVLANLHWISVTFFVFFHLIVHFLLFFICDYIKEYFSGQNTSTVIRKTLFKSQIYWTNSYFTIRILQLQFLCHLFFSHLFWKEVTFYEVNTIKNGFSVIIDRKGFHLFHPFIPLN